MKTSEQALKELLVAVDVAAWAWAVKQNSRRRGVVDWKGAIDDLCKSYDEYQRAILNETHEAVIS